MLKSTMFLNKFISRNILWNENVELKPHEIIKHWPVEARRKPLLSNSPAVFLDLPDLDTHFCKNIVDWGNTGYIATIFDSQVHLWHPDKKVTIKVSTEFYDNTVEKCIRWNRDGSLFAVAVNINQVAVYDILGNKVSSNTGSCACSVKNSVFNKLCTIISIEWTKSNILLTGCSNGTLTKFNANLKWQRFRYRVHSEDIIKLALSCNENYLTSVGMDKTMLIMKYPELDVIQSCRLETTKAIAWHPWKDSLLVLGETDHFFLWNVQNQKVSSSIIFPNTYIDSLIFNPMSAELLVSQHLYDEDGNTVSYLRVMKNLNCIVDEVRCNEYRIPYLLWDPTATKLGTASTDQNFCIWDFFGRRTKQEKKYKNTKRDVYANDIFKNNGSFGSVIR
ncbi:unnamed protein product [Diabrotica balteata]|uniref:Protein cortex n=1 Tax=Diabrotica balteata TaxID=107213 RepID=A0A9P0E275_DIABA|nr:unnamed protein product [Diabrotica balteata]